MTHSVALWYVARATGLVSLLLLTASVTLGVVTRLGISAQGWPRFSLAAVHRSISLLTATFLAVHITSSVIDSYAGIGWLDAIVPFGSVYRPVWLGLGAIALDLLTALVATSLLRPHINVRLWRAVHWVSYLCWPLAMVHALGTGTDNHGWALLVALGCLAVVGAAGVSRILTGGRPA